MASKRRGVSQTQVFHLVGKDPANSKHPQLDAFSLRFSELSPFALKEILDLTEAQETRFLKAYDIAKLALERFGIWPRTPQERQELMELDELEQGYPSMTLTHLYDVIREIEAKISQSDSEPYLETRLFSEKRIQLRQIIDSHAPPGSVPSWRALMGKIGKIKRLKIFDSPAANRLDYEKHVATWTGVDPRSFGH